MKKTLYGLLVIVISSYLLTGVVQVRPGEKGVIRRFGKVLPHMAEPGLHIGLPWGLDRVDRVAVDRVHQLQVGFTEDDGGKPLPAGQMLTGDHNLVNLQVHIYYKVDPAMIVEYALHEQSIPEILSRYVESCAADWVATRSVDITLLTGKVTLGREIVSLTRERLADNQLGVELLDAQVSLLNPPDEVKPSFDAVARAQTNMTTLLYKAEQETEAKLLQAQSEQFRILQEALALASSMKLQASRDAERFLVRLANLNAGLRDNPSYLKQIWEEERGRILSKLRDQGKIGLLDNHLNSQGLEINSLPLDSRPR